MDERTPGINVCFSTTNHLSSRIIRAITRSPVSHALLTYRDATLGKVMVLEAVGDGFHVVPWSRWRKTNTLVERYELAISTDVQLAALREISELLGQGYDYLGALGWLSKRWRVHRNPLESRTRLFCSEVVALYLRRCEISGIGDPSLEAPIELLTRARLGSPFVLRETRTRLLVS